MKREMSNETLASRIVKRMDELQKMMESNQHLKQPKFVEDHIHNITKFWPVLQDEDKDYIHTAQYAVEERIEWNV